MFRNRTAALAATIAAAATCAQGSASAKDYASVARDIIPSGQYGSVPAPANAAAQAIMYDALTPLFSHVTQADLLADFKPEPLGTANSGPLMNEPVQNPGVTVVRDRFDVPHIYGKTRDDVTWGAGWVLAEDRGLLLQQARYDSRVAAIDAPGVDALGLVSSLKSFRPSAKTESEVAKQTGALLASGRKGRDVLHDIDVFLQGINAYLGAHNHVLGPFPNVADFTRNDIYAFNALKDQFVGEGGGDEAQRSEFLSALSTGSAPSAAWEFGTTCASHTIPRRRRACPGTCSCSRLLAARRGMWSLTPAACQAARRKR